MHGTRSSLPFQRRAVGAAVAVGALLLTAACGAGSQTAASQATSVGCDITQPSKATTVNVLAYNSSADRPLHQHDGASCRGHNLTFKHDPVDFGDRCRRRRPPWPGSQRRLRPRRDLLLVVPQYAADKLVPLDDCSRSTRTSTSWATSATISKGMTYDGKLYGLPTQARRRLHGLPQGHLRRAAAEAAEDVRRDARRAAKIQATGKIKYPVALPLLATGDISTRFMIGLFSQGTTYVDRRTKKPKFDSAQGKQALRRMKDLVPYMDPQVTTFDQPKVQQQLYNGSAAIADDVLRPDGRHHGGRRTRSSRQVRLREPPAIESGGKPLCDASRSTAGRSRRTRRSTRTRVPGDRLPR